MEILGWKFTYSMDFLCNHSISAIIPSSPLSDPHLHLCSYIQWPTAQYRPSEHSSLGWATSLWLPVWEWHMSKSSAAFLLRASGGWWQWLCSHRVLSSSQSSVVPSLALVATQAKFFPSNRWSQDRRGSQEPKFSSYIKGKKNNILTV